VEEDGEFFMTQPVEQWDFIEIPFAFSPAGNPFLDVTLSALFTCDDQQVHVNGFYDGNGVYKVRFMPDRVGEWRYVTHSSLANLDGQQGSFLCITPSANNHGPVRVVNQMHFAYEDGTPYIPVGTTCYVWNLQGDELEEQTLKTLEQSPFNKMRMCVFPKRYSFNTNEPPCYPFPGEVTKPWDASMLFSDQATEPPDYWDFSQFNPDYFHRLEKRILDLRERGIEADLIVFHPYDMGAWGFDRMPAEVNDRYLRYLVARLSAFRNMWWSFANEYDLFPERTMADWDHYMQLVQQEDPYNHLRSIHNCGAFYDHTQPWVTHCSVQNGAISRVPTWRKMYNKPVVIDECGYEGNIWMSWGDLSAEEMVFRFWLGFTLGGYVGHGETYLNPEEVLWWSKGGTLRGESPARIAFLRQIFEQAPALTPLDKPDLEHVNLMGGGIRKLFADIRAGSDPIAAAGFGAEACGYNTEKGYYLCYYGMHQPAIQRFDLQGGLFRVDIIDTWNMTSETVVDQAAGITTVNLPLRKHMAIRIQKTSTPNVDGAVAG
jgi:hypothetical protein